MSSRTIDMCNGPLVKKIVVFSAPIILSGILQLLFTAVDMVVVGQFAESSALAAVGATSATINLLINLFTALSVGVSVSVSKNFGANSHEDVSQTVHTAMMLSIITGVFVGVMGFALSRPILILIDTPIGILEKATLYMKIYFIGMPASMVYNFGAAILRAVGDSKRPMYYLTIGGVVNVILNLIFVLGFGMDVDGVALGTVASQTLAAILVVIRLMREDGCIRLVLKELKIYTDKLVDILKVGIPAGVSGCIFSASNMIVQASLNSFNNDLIIAGTTISGNIECFVYMAMVGFNNAAITFTAQNYGAGKFYRIKKVLFHCSWLVTLVSIVMGLFCILLDKELLGIYSPDPEVVKYGALRLNIICITYFICGIMEVLVGTLRGMGFSTITTLISVLGIVGVRVIWIYTIFANHRTLEMLYWSYPASWLFIALALLVCFMVAYHKTATTRVSIE